MLATFFNEFYDTVPIHWDNNLFPRGAFSGYLYVGLRPRSTFDNLLDLVNFASTEG